MADKKERIEEAKKWLTEDAYRATKESPRVNLRGQSLDSATFVNNRKNNYKQLNKELGVGESDGSLKFFGIDIPESIAKDEYKEKADKVRNAEKNIKNWGGKKMDDAVNYFLSGGKKDKEDK